MQNNQTVQKLKKIFLSIMKEYSVNFSLPKEEIKESLLSKYNCQGIEQLAKKLTDEIKSLACFNSYIENPQNMNAEEQKIYSEKLFEMNKQLQSGDVYMGTNILNLAYHFYYENKLINEKILPYKIVYNLWCHIGNGNYYTFESERILDFFRKSIELYMIKRDNCAEITSTNDKIISAIDYFKFEHNIDYIIENGSVKITDFAEEKIHKNIEKKVADIGGQTVLKILFENELVKTYSPLLRRFLICKNKKLYSKDYETPIAYNYIIQICLKHLKKDIAHQIDEKILTVYQQIIQDCKYYIDILEVYNANPLSETMIDVLGLLDYITNNAIFENLCIPMQYNCYYLEKILNFVYKPALKQNQQKPRLYSSNSFYKLLKVFFYELCCKKFTIKELSKKTNISTEIIKNFLDSFSIEAEQSNSNYQKPLSFRTSSHKPLIKINSNEYFFLSPQFLGYSFFNSIQDEMNSTKFNRELGHNYEIFAKKLLDEKGYKYKYGHYSPKNQKEKGECDLILEDDKNILFIEIKNCGLPYEFEVVDNVKILFSLGEGMLKAQKQILHHKLHLMKNNQKMLLYENVNDSIPKFELNNSQSKRIYAISLCSSEYAFFTSGIIGKILTENLASINFNAYDKAREKDLKKINKLSVEMRALIEDFSKYQQPLTNNDLFFETSFKTMQQFYIALKLSNNITEFIDYLTFETYISFQYFDFYANLLAKISLNK